MKRLIVIALACALSPVALAQLYKYVDKDGKVHYTDQPPSTVDPQTMKLQTAPTPGAVPEKSALEREKDAEKGKAKGKEDPKKAEQLAREAAAKKERCASSTERYRQFSEGGRIYKSDPKTGERSFMEESEMEAERDKARKIMDEACK
jgi:hypothetical protein